MNTDDFGAFETAVTEDSSAGEFPEFAEIDGEQFYRMQWVTDSRYVLQCLRETNGTIATATLNSNSAS